MNSLLKQVKKLQKGHIAQKVKLRLVEFRAFQQKSELDWFSELCFCILTANAKSKTACNVQAELGGKGFLEISHKELVSCIKRNKHRFHNTKAARIVEARKHLKIKSIVQQLLKDQGIMFTREFLVENIKGYGFKEASHFLRNVGYFDVAILDRHILNLMNEHGIIRKIPPLSKKNYLKLEQKFFTLAKEAKMSPAELDMYMWYMKAGDVLK